MAVLKQRLHRKNSSGTYDTVYLETSASLVLMANGNSAETEIMSKLPIHGVFTDDIDSFEIEYGIWTLDNYRNSNTSLGVFPFDNTVYGTFIQYPGVYKTQVILAGIANTGMTGYVRRKFVNSGTWSNWLLIGGSSKFYGTIGTNWTEDSETGVKSQLVSIDGILATHELGKIDVIMTHDRTSDGYAAFVEENNQFLEFITNGDAETVDGGIIFYVYGDVNTINIPFGFEVS